MHSFSLRDDISVSSARTAASRATYISESSFHRSFSLTRRKSRDILNFRDDLSEYSNPSNWGERAGPLSLSDHRLGTEGLQARRTAGEAFRAQWGRRTSEFPEFRSCEYAMSGSTTKSESCSTCFAHSRFPRINMCLETMRRWREPRVSTVFTWAEVLSLLLLPSEENGPYLIVISTVRPAADGSREWLLQAGSLRACARWGIEMSYALLQVANQQSTQPPFQPFCGARSACRCCGPVRSPTISLVLLMDIVRVACEVARHQPSADGMYRLIEVLDLLVETQRSDGEQKPMQPPTPPIPIQALRRFSDSVRRAHMDFTEWLLWWEVSVLVSEPPGIDAHIWRVRILPFLTPKGDTEKDQDADTAEGTAYPAAVDAQLVSAAERCHRTLTS